jgi:ankyrin repeat protein
MKKKPHAVAAVAFFIAAASANAQNASLMELVKAGSPLDIKKALGQGLDGNARDAVNGWTPLMYAARFNRDPAAIEALLDSGAKIEARADDGSTALMCAAAGNTNPEVISALVKRGAQVDARADGWTALMCAAGFNDNPEVVLALLKAGANAKLRDNTGRTAFDRARLNDRIRGTEAYAALKRAVSD